MSDDPFNVNLAGQSDHEHRIGFAFKPMKRPGGSQMRGPVTEECRFCSGSGTVYRAPEKAYSDDERSGYPPANCPTCRGRTTIRVNQPAQRCEACKGTGRAPVNRWTESGRQLFTQCEACRGTGWLQ